MNPEHLKEGLQGSKEACKEAVEDKDEVKRTWKLTRVPSAAGLYELQ